LSVAIASELGDRLRFQVLIYPAGDNKLNTESWQTYANRAGSFIRGWSTGMGMVFTKEEDKQNPLAVPVLIKTLNIHRLHRSY
jgi:acetyl esterase